MLNVQDVLYVLLRLHNGNKVSTRAYILMPKKHTHYIWDELEVLTRGWD